MAGPPGLVAVTTVGPGRLFADLARRGAANGVSCLRFEPSGFGASDRRQRGSWADFYHPTTPAEIEAAIDEVARRGIGPVTVTGFCAGAWSALHVEPRAELAGIITINLQAQIWLRLPHRRWWPDLGLGRSMLSAGGRHHQVARVVKRAEREMPLPGPAARRIRRHTSESTDVMLVFTPGDEGERHYRRRAERWLAAHGRHPAVAEYPGLGHLPAGSVRERMVDEVIARVAGSGGRDGSITPNIELVGPSS